MNRQPPHEDDRIPADDAIARHREALKARFPLPAPVKRSRRSPGSTVGLFAAALAMAGGLIWLDPAYRNEDHASAPGQVQTIALADGSQVTLDGDSRIRVSWHLRSRRVELQAGQALFAVAPMSYRPFLTQAGATRIVVVGTRYNVSRLGDEVQVTVSEGRVAVHGRGDTLLLSPGEQVRVRAGELGTVTRVDAEASAAWVDGRLVFERTPLGEVLDALQRHTGIRVNLSDASLAELPVSGRFERSRLEGLPALLPKILPVDLTTGPDGVPMLSRRQAKK